MNLIVNAFDAMPDGGQLSIETSQKHLEILLGGHDNIPAKQYVIMRVRDTGTGIGGDDLGRIFEPYYSKKTMGTSGSGLGLSIVYGIVKDHKGYYDVFSKLGEGTEFVLYFPVAAEEEMKPVVDIKSAITGDESILIIDDSDEQRELAKVLLTNLGYNVTTVEDDHAAIEYLKTNRAQLVVMDMIMEVGFDGLDSYREIVKSNPGQKAIIVSGFSNTERVSAMQELGAGNYVRKPYTQTALGRAVRDELDRVNS
jgi:two-component system cell cycle sensor histidine kinase/response regulator CckA